ncbi:PAS domain-containing methyl-accepting chemotaxis protein [Acidovorax sp. Root70]|uniref:methyl-accepting chemotaxis protein n=1 Tax=Acidovorax sp. Root70 TaxID=1736590 RepID=UPI0006FFDA88|nr:PAS domain-containing methyl-accepting chemotaxis protein [Acidovorax sp. Root70]KRB42209.1 diguanylate cyclase [Acidovorax sp. Root70]
MRSNVYVTQRDYPLSEGDTLLSTTDLKGRIVYANDAFIKVSGFGREELYGKAHNVVRHPDMPAAAFEDMWATIRGGLPWSSLVKNRRKDGDHYWVRANASPIRQDGTVVGFLSVRTKASDDEIRTHETLYQRINAGARHLRVYRGFVVGVQGLAAAWARLRFLSLGVRLHGALGALLLGGALALVAGGSASVGANASAGGQAAGAGWWLAGLVAWCAAGAAAAWWLQTGVVTPLREVLAQARAVASGQKAEPLMLQRVDEIGGLMRSVQQAGLNMMSLVSDIQGKALQVRECATELQDGNTHLSERTEEAASSLEEAATALDELTAAIRANSDKAALAAQRAGLGAQAAALGADTVQRVQHTMQGIASASQRVAEISTLIDGIAFQTNLLALNAAVEAARAGEHGKGFAVVATEVRALSQKSARAARDIKALIDASLAEVRSGTDAAVAAAQTMDSAVRSVHGLSELVQDIQQASHEQALGVGQINSAVAQLEQMTQQNATLVRRSAELSGSLAQQARHLDEAASVFQPRGTVR